MTTNERPSRLSWRDETPADTRALDLREAGYQGHIDRDGNATDKPLTMDDFRQTS